MSSHFAATWRTSSAVTASMSPGQLRHVRDSAADGERRTVDPRQRGLAVLRIDSVGDQPGLRPRKLLLVDALVDELGDDVLEILFKGLQASHLGGARRRS